MVEDWQRFVIDHGAFARADHLVQILGKTRRQIDALRGSCRRSGARRGGALGFAQLFQLWHGRDPDDEDWPLPKRRRTGHYEWLPVEDALLATLVGLLSVNEIAEVLTERLRRVTDDTDAQRSRAAVLLRINRIGLTTTDVPGGITVSAAARQIGCETTVRTAIARGRLEPRRVGRLLVIPFDQWEAFQRARKAPPVGTVSLSSLKRPLGIASDKLSEYARAGYIPGAEQCNLIGSKSPNTQFGTWHVPQHVADRLLADRAQGLPMPWHGKPYLGNLTASWKKWTGRKHPDTCPDCRRIWGSLGAPANFEDFKRRYPALTRGAKRHLTWKFNPGLTVHEVATACAVPAQSVRDAIDTGRLRAVEHDGGLYVSRVDATRWKAMHAPTGRGRGSWIALDVAAKRYGFPESQLRAWIADETLVHKVGDAGPMRGITYLLKHQCARLRETIGYSPKEAARRLGLAPAQARVLLDQLDWRGGEAVPLYVIQAAQKRMASNNGMTIAEAAGDVGQPEEWVEAQIAAGRIRVLTVPWRPDRRYLSDIMVRRLHQLARAGGANEVSIPPNWIRVSAAAVLAGVSSTIMSRWGRDGEVRCAPAPSGVRYDPESVRDRACRYWDTARWKRRAPPAWLRLHDRTRHTDDRA